MNKIHQILQSRGVYKTQFIKWTSQMWVADQFTKRFQQSGARMSCETYMKQLLPHRTKSSPSIYLIDVMKIRINSAYRDAHEWQFILSDFFYIRSWMYGLTTNSGRQSWFTYILVITLNLSLGDCFKWINRYVKQKDNSKKMANKI